MPEKSHYQNPSLRWRIDILFKSKKATEKSKMYGRFICLFDGSWHSVTFLTIFLFKLKHLDGPTRINHTHGRFDKN